MEMELHAHAMTLVFFNGHVERGGTTVRRQFGIFISDSLCFSFDFSYIYIQEAFP